MWAGPLLIGIMLTVTASGHFAPGNTTDKLWLDASMWIMFLLGAVYLRLIGKERRR